MKYALREMRCACDIFFPMNPIYRPAIMFRFPSDGGAEGEEYNFSNLNNSRRSSSIMLE